MAVSVVGLDAVGRWHMRVTALYAGLLVPLFLVLSVRVILARRGAQVAVGDGGDAMLQRRARVQANFAEYAPLGLGLVLLGLAEGLGTWPLVLHGLGLMLLAGRGLHAFGMSVVPERFVFRVSGMVLTLTMLAMAAAVCLVGALRGA